MKNIFEEKNIKPMLIGKTEEAFDSPDYIYELKLDGERCIAYLDKQGVELRNKRNNKMLPKVPELNNIHKQIKNRCILDGELIVIKDGKPDFFEIQRRSLMSNTFKIKLASSSLPASFTAFDILYYADQQVTDLPLIERKSLLEKNIIENERVAISRFIDNDGIYFYELAKEKQLEGIVAKRKNSKYFFDKRTNDWIKIKNLLDDDFIICGYENKEKYVASIILGQFFNNNIIYKGSVVIGKSSNDFTLIKSIPKINAQPFKSQKESLNIYRNIIWIEPKLVCTVKYMLLTASGSMRQPVYKGLRTDKTPKECIAKFL